MDGRIVIGTPFSDHQHRIRGLSFPPIRIEHAWSGLTILRVRRVVQGSDLEQRPLAFEQVLKFIRTIRSTRSEYGGPWSLSAGPLPETGPNGVSDVYQVSIMHIVRVSDEYQRSIR